MSTFFPLISSADWGGRATRAEVNLDAIEANIRRMCAAAGSAALMAVVKADAYGHGADQVAHAARRGGASWLGVYTVEEGVVLRRAGLSCPILVFGPFQPAEAAHVVAHRLTPTVTNLEAAEALQRVAKGPIEVHVKVDTGLSRAGVAAPDIGAFGEALRQYPALRLQGLFTHFARADEEDKEPSWDQLREYLQAAQTLRDQGYTDLVQHTANSAAALDLPETHLDMVRCGIATYGYYPSDVVTHAIDLTPALSLVSAISRVHRIPPGTGVGYGHEFRSRRETVIALAPVGYGDGLERRLGHGNGRAIVRGVSVPIVGRLSMDQMTLDVTDVPGVSLGDQVTLIGASGSMWQSAEDLAAQAGTISYDVLTGILPRVPRLYVRDQTIVAHRTLTSSPAALSVESGD